jgi:hypothetical protein
VLFPWIGHARNRFTQELITFASHGTAIIGGLIGSGLLSATRSSVEVFVHVDGVRSKRCSTALGAANGHSHGCVPLKGGRSHPGSLH